MPPEPDAGAQLFAGYFQEPLPEKAFGSSYKPYTILLLSTASFLCKNSSLWHLIWIVNFWGWVVNFILIIFCFIFWIEVLVRMLPVANPIVLEWNHTILTLGIGEESIKNKIPNPMTVSLKKSFASDGEEWIKTKLPTPWRCPWKYWAGLACLFPAEKFIMQGLTKVFTVVAETVVFKAQVGSIPGKVLVKETWKSVSSL